MCKNCKQKQQIIENLEYIEIKYLGKDNVTWQAPSKMLYRPKPGHTFKVLKDDVSWFLSKNNKGKPYFSGIGTSTIDTITEATAQQIAKLTEQGVQQVAEIQEQITQQVKEVTENAMQQIVTITEHQTEQIQEDKPKRRRKKDIDSNAGNSESVDSSADTTESTENL